MRGTCIALAVCMWGCGFPRPADVNDDGGVPTDGGSCIANQALRCEGANLVRCNTAGDDMSTDNCLLGCNATALRCNDVAPSNDLARYLEMSAAEPDFDLGTAATINTDNGTVMLGDTSVTIKSALVAQSSGPTMLVFMVHSLKTSDVTVTGANAFVAVSDGDVQIGGVFTASAVLDKPGPGGFNDSVCRGADLVSVGNALGGVGGGAFGRSGGNGGSTTTTDGTAVGGAGGKPSGNDSLIPLRGGCDSGRGGAGFGSGGGAIQLVSRSKITVSGVLAANGSSFTGGGSGGGLLLEAPTVEVSGTIVANGGAGGGICLLPQPGEDGRLDSVPAMGGPGCGSNRGPGGNGGAGATAAADAVNVSAASGSAAAGGGGGGVGRIRVNTVLGGFHRAGLFSPSPSTGTIGTR